ncbi:MAG: AAA family ATPase [Bacteroidaceae bacterium]|nr:AAA family ATPase [Bacteroidaceae bacterium]
MIYLSSFKVSDHRTSNPNLYPYNVFRKKDIFPFVFAPVTIFYGKNGSGKSTLLNLIAHKIRAKGYEEFKHAKFSMDEFVSECIMELGEDDDGRKLKIPDGSIYMKSEDILYEVKKIEQESVLENGYVFDQMRIHNLTKEQAITKLHTPVVKGGTPPLANMLFAQEKYSNGETAMQILEECLSQTDNLYLLDEPEVSLSPMNQVKLADEINKMARLLGCQFIIATHSPFMLGTLHAKIYNIDDPCMDEARWHELENVRFFYDFFKKHEREFI